MNIAAEWIRAHVRAVRDVAPDVREIEIDAGKAGASASPGSHIDVSVNIAGRPATRSYSTLGPGENGVYTIAVKRMQDGRGGSAFMWALGPGAPLSITRPLNHFELNRDCTEYLLIAGGIGVTPIFSMAQALAQSGANFRILYAGRARSHMAYAAALEALCGGRLQVFARDEGKRIDIAREIAGLGDRAEVYVCGPIGMLEEARACWRKSGRPAQALRFETFANSGHFANAAFTVNLPLLGRSIEVGAAQTLLEALEAAGVEAMSDCRRGECGLCALDIIACDGQIDHRDVFFSDEEKAEGHKLCACVSRVAGGSISVDTGERRG